MLIPAAPGPLDSQSMTLPVLFAAGGSDAEWSLAQAGAPAELDRLVPPPGGAEEGPWEIEIGFGKGRYLLRRAAAEPGRRFLGLEMATQYFRILVDRARRRPLPNLLAVRGEALYLLAAALPRRFAEAVHVYHPDPWPKVRHQKRRLLDPITLDLVLGTLVPGGRLYFETDHGEYGEVVEEVLSGHPAVAFRRVEGGWPDGPRTNYEAKYVEEGRPILRLEATFAPGEDAASLHPLGEEGILAAARPPSPAP